jgi:hypothetical protein
MEESPKIPLDFLEDTKVFFDKDCKITMPMEMHSLLMELLEDNEEYEVE